MSGDPQLPNTPPLIQEQAEPQVEKSEDLKSKKSVELDAKIKTFPEGIDRPDFVDVAKSKLENEYAGKLAEIERGLGKPLGEMSRQQIYWNTVGRPVEKLAESQQQYLRLVQEKNELSESEVTENKSEDVTTQAQLSNIPEGANRVESSVNLIELENSQFEDLNASLEQLISSLERSRLLDPASWQRLRSGLGAIDKLASAREVSVDELNHALSNITSGIEEISNIQGKMFNRDDFEDLRAVQRNLKLVAENSGDVFNKVRLVDDKKIAETLSKISQLTDTAERKSYGISRLADTIEDYLYS